MDWNPVIAFAAVASVAIPGFVVYRDWRRDQRDTAQKESDRKQRAEWEREQESERKRRAEWEHEQEQRQEQRQREQELRQQAWEQRQLDAEAPHLKPISATWQGLTDIPLARPMADAKQQDIELHNIGKSTPEGVAGVLFGARIMNPQSHILTDNLYGTYWAGNLSVSPAADGRAHLLLDHEHYPLSGDQSVIDGLTLFAPDEPILSPTKSTGPNLFARLTMTYRDTYGRTLAVVYDAEAVWPDGSKIEWRRAAKPTEVSKSLQELIDEARRRRG